MASEIALDRVSGPQATNMDDNLDIRTERIDIRLKISVVHEVNK